MYKIKLYILNIIKAINKVKENGFFHIIISSSLVKIISFISAMFLPRIISNKYEYGLLVYVDNINGYIMLVNGIGILNAVLRYCSREDKDQNKKGYFLITLLVGIIFDLALIILTVAAYLVIPIPFYNARELLILLSLLPLVAFLFEDIQLLLRACFENKKYSILNLFYSILMVIAQIGFALLWGVKGVVTGRYIAGILAVFLGLIFIRNFRVIKAKAIFPQRKVLIEMILFGIIMMFSNATSLVLQLNETFILGAILKDTSVLADYKVASYILVVSTFIIQSIAIFILPYFYKRGSDKVWVWKNFKKLMFMNAAIMLPLHIILILLSKQLIIVVFGIQYINAIPIMQMLLVGSLGQTTVRMLTGSILVTVGEEKFNLRINIIFIIVHAVIDIWAVKIYGIYGAAIALTLVYFSSGIWMLMHLRKVCKVSVKEVVTK